MHLCPSSLQSALFRGDIISSKSMFLYTLLWLLFWTNCPQVVVKLASSLRNRRLTSPQLAASLDSTRKFAQRLCTHVHVCTPACAWAGVTCSIPLLLGREKGRKSKSLNSTGIHDIGNNWLAGYMPYRQDRTAASGKTRGGGWCTFVNNSWCTISKEVSMFCSPEVEYLMISCRPHYLHRVIICIFRSCLHTTTD
jgi:hypothetical protein